MIETNDIGIVSSFGVWSFGSLSDFGFRYSDLVAAEGRLGRTIPWGEGQGWARRY